MYKSSYKLLLPLLLALFMVFQTSTTEANHIYGADLSYKYLGKKPGNPSIDLYEITLIYYRDCNPANNPAQLAPAYEFGAYNGLNNSQVIRFSLNQVSVTPLLEYAPRCVYPAGICIEEGLYQGTIELPNNLPGNPGFHISHYTWRRNVTTNNVNPNGGNTWGPGGIAMYCYIPPSSFQNSSPVFLAKPVPYMCVSSASNPRVFGFNHNGFDPNGDSLVFTWAHPYGGIGSGGNQTGNAVDGKAGGVPNSPLPLGATPRPNPPLPGATYNPNGQSYPLVPYAGGYSYPNNQMPLRAGGAGLTINPATGEITAEPGLVGRFVLCVEVKEYRINRAAGTATYLGAIRRDLIFFVGNTCTTNDPPTVTISNISPAQASTDSFIIDEGNTLQFDITATDPDIGDSVFLFRSGTFFDGSSGVPPPYAVMNEDSGRNSAKSTFTWTPDCTFARVAPYFFNIIVFDNQCNRVEKTIFIKVNPKEIILPPDLRCIRTLDNNTIELNWLRSPSDTADFLHYRIYRRVRGMGNFVAVDSIPNIYTTSWQDRGVANAKTTSYEYYITGINKCYEEGLPSATLRSMIVTGIKQNATTLDLSWTTVTDSAGYGTTYRIYSQERSNGVRQLETSTSSLLALIQACDLEDSRFIVEITDPLSGCISFSCTDYFRLKDSIPPSPPNVLGVTVNSPTEIQVDFNRSDSLDVGEYVIFRGVNGSALTRFDSFPATNAATYAYQDATVSSQVNVYCYEVYAKDTCDNLSLPSVKHCDVRLSGIAGQRSAVLNWNAYVGFTASGQEVERNDGGGWVNIANLPASATTYTDLNLSACILYQYRILVYDASSNAYISFSSIEDVQPLDTIPPPAPNLLNGTVTSPTSVDLIFDPSSRSSVSAYEVFVSANGGAFTSTGLFPFAGAGPGSVSVGGLNTVNNVLCFYLEAYDSCSMINSSPSNQHCVINLQGTPGNLRAILNWSAYSGWPVGVANYQVEKFTGSWTPITGLLPASQRSHVDSIGLACGVPYRYRIKGFESGGTSYVTFSNEVTVIPFKGTPPPNVDLRNVSVSGNNGQLDIQFDKVNDPTVEVYDIELSVNGGPYNLVNSIFSPGAGLVNTSVSGLNAGDNQYCIKIYAVDTCGSRSDAVAAEEHCVSLLQGVGGNLSAILNWSAYQGYAVANYEVEKWISGSWQRIATTSSTSYTDSPLPCNTDQIYRVKVLEQAGNSSVSYSNLDTIVPFDTIRPLAPELASVTVLNGGIIRTVFKPSTSPDVNAYRMFYSTNGGPFVQGGTRPAGGGAFLTYDQTGINTSVNRYCFYVVAIDSCSGTNISDPSNIHCAINLQTSPGNLAVDLIWRPYTGFNFNQYTVQRWNGAGFTNIATVPASDTTYRDMSNLSCNQPYIYRIQASEVGGNSQLTVSNQSTSIPFDTVNPMRPEMIGVFCNVRTQNKIEFMPSPSGDVGLYEVYASTNFGPFSRIGNVIENGSPSYTFNHGGLDNKFNTYCYYVLAIDSCSSSNRSPRSDVHCHIQLTPVAGNLRVDLSWTKYIGYNVSGYTLQRQSPFNPGVWQTIASKGPNDTTHIDTGSLACNVNYLYRVLANEAGGNGHSTISDVHDARPRNSVKPDKAEILNVSVTGLTSIDIDFKPSITNTVGRYILYRATYPTPGFIQVASIPAGGASTYTDNFGAASTRAWSYKIEAEDSCSAVRSDRSDAHSTMYVSLSQTGCSKQVNVRWNRYTHWTSGLARQELWRSVNGGAFTFLANINTNDSTYADASVSYNTDYCYKVIAYSNGGAYTSSSGEVSCINLSPLGSPQIRLVSVTGTGLSNGSVRVDWNSLASVPFAATYNLYHSTSPGGPFNLIGAGLPIAQTTFNHTNINTKTQEHYYAISMLDSCGNESDTSSAHKTIDMTLRSGQVSHIIDWTPYLGNTVNSYQIFRYDGSSWISMIVLPASARTHTFYPAPCNSPFYYRVNANMAEGISESDTAGIRSIDSLKADPATITNASVVAQNRIEVSYTEGDSVDIFAYVIYRSTNGGAFQSVNWIPASGPGNTSIYLDTINAATGYHCYMMEAVDSCLNLTSSSSFCAIQLEGSPGNLTNNLVWRPLDGYNVSQYTVQWRDAGVWTSIANVPGTDTMYTHTGLSCNLPYDYRVVAANGDSSITSLSDIKTLTPFDTVSPSSPTIVRASVIGATQVEVVFDASPSSDVDRYDIQFSANGGAFNTAGILNNIGLGRLRFVHSGIDPINNRYCYRVVAVDSCQDNQSASSATHCLNALSQSAGNLSSNLSWTGYSGFGINWYYVQKFVNGMWVTIDSIPGNSPTLNYVDSSSLECNVLYHYRIFSPGTGAGVFSYSDSVVVIPFDTVAPSSPSIVRASVLSATSAEVVFDASASGDVNRYEIRYSQNGGAYMAAGVLNNIGPGRLRFVHNGIDPINNLYCYQVVAIDSCNDNRSGPSLSHCLNDLSLMAGNLSSILNWSGYAGFGVEWYYIQRFIGGSWLTIDSVSGLSGIQTYVDTGSLECNQVYRYRVLSSGSSSDRFSYSDSNIVVPFDTVPPLPPLLNYASVLSDTSIEINWRSSTSGDAEGYELWRKDPGGSFVMVFSGQGVFNFIDRVNNTLNERYEYYAIAIDSCNVSNRSQPSPIHITSNLESPTKKTCSPEIRINWNPYTFFPTGLSEYKILRSVSGGPFVPFDTVPAVDTNFLDAAIDTSFYYCYRVEALSNSPGIYSSTDTFCIKPSLFPETDSTFIKNTTVLTTDPINGSIQIDWRGVDPLIDTLAEGYNLYHSNNAAGPFSLVYAAPSLFDTSFIHTGINTRFRNHFYRLSVADSCGGESDSSALHSPVKIDVLNGNLQTVINWTGYRGWNAGGYQIQRSQNGGAWLNYAGFSRSDTSLIDSALSCGEQYAYRIVTTQVNPPFHVSYSDTITLVAFDTIPPDPANLIQATVFSSSQSTGEIDLQFESPTQSNRSGYRIERSINGLPPSSVVVLNTSSGTLSYRDNNLNTQDDLHTYKVYSLDSCGNESDSSVVHQPVNLSVTALSEVNNLSWTGYRGFSSFAYTVERRTASSPWIAIASLSSAASSYADSSVLCDTLYSYRIRSSESIGNMGVSRSDTEAVLAIDLSNPISPEVNFVSVDSTSATNGRVIVNWANSSSNDIIRYFLYRRLNTAPSWQLIATLGPVNSYLDVGLNTSDDIYLYRLEAEDSCGNLSLVASAFDGNIHLDGLPGNESARLSWSSYVGATVSSYQIWRDGVLIGTVAGNVNEFVDTFLLCTEQYRYQVRGVLSNGGFLSWSNFDDVRPFDTNAPLAAYVLAASVDQGDSSVSVMWLNSMSFDVNYYEVFKEIDNSGNRELVYRSNSTADTSFTDLSFFDWKNSTYCYYVVVHDFCGNTGDTSNVGCVIKLSGESLDLASELRWTPYTLWDGGVDKYEIWRSDDGAAEIKVGEVAGSELTFIDSDLAEDVRDFCYRIQGVEGLAGFGGKSWSNTICLYQKPKIFFPTAFSPVSSIGLNDFFGPVGTYYDEMEMRIFNRWGEQIFYTKDKDVTWNGKHNNTGDFVPQGTYVYMVRIVDYDGIPYKFKGMINVVY